MKNLLLLPLLFLYLLSAAQPDSIKQQHKKNPIFKNFKFEYNDFYPSQSIYTHKSIRINQLSVWGNSVIDKKIFPVVYRNGDYLINVVYVGQGWAFLDRLDLKIGEAVYQHTLKDCNRVVLHGGTVKETCQIELSPILYKDLINTEEVKARAYGKNYYYDYEIDRDVWDDSYFLIKELSKKQE